MSVIQLLPRNSRYNNTQKSLSITFPHSQEALQAQRRDGGLRRLRKLIGPYPAHRERQPTKSPTTTSRAARTTPRTATAAHLTSAMATIRPMRPDDLLHFSSTNLDHLTETYNIGFYLEYLTKWPELCQVIEGLDGEIEGYSTSPSLPLFLIVHVSNVA